MISLRSMQLPRRLEGLTTQSVQIGDQNLWDKEAKAIEDICMAEIFYKSAAERTQATSVDEQDSKESRKNTNEETS